MKTSHHSLYHWKQLNSLREFDITKKQTIDCTTYNSELVVVTTNYLIIIKTCCIQNLRLIKGFNIL